MQDGQKRPMGIQNWGDQLEPDHMVDNSNTNSLENANPASTSFGHNI